MKKVKIDVTNIHTVGALHVYLAYMLDLPAHYGRNLDALFDALCEESREMTIVLYGAGETQGELTAYMPRLLRVLEDAVAQNACLHAQIR